MNSPKTNPGVTLTSSVEQQIRRDLLSAAFLPGQRLAIDILRERYGTGASPVREALSRLSAEGLVVQLDQRGFRVPAVSVDELNELTRTRSLLNEITLREAIARGGSDYEEGIVLALHRLSATPMQDPGEPTRINPEWEQRHQLFHASLIAACGSRWLIDFDATLFEQSARYRSLSARATSTKRDTQKEHEEIARAVLARDATEAIRLLNRHIEHTARLVSQITPRFETSEK